MGAIVQIKIYILIYTKFIIQFKILGTINCGLLAYLPLTNLIQSPGFQKWTWNRISVLDFNNARMQNRLTGTYFWNPRIWMYSACKHLSPQKSFRSSTNFKFFLMYPKTLYINFIADSASEFISSEDQIDYTNHRMWKVYVKDWRHFNLLYELQGSSYNIALSSIVYCTYIVYIVYFCFIAIIRL